MMHYSREFILAQFLAFQRGGCRDQTFIDNAPFFVESLLALTAPAPEAPACRRCGEQTRQYHDATGSPVYLVGVCTRCRTMTDGASDGAA